MIHTPFEVLTMLKSKRIILHYPFYLYGRNEVIIGRHHNHFHSINYEQWKTSTIPAQDFLNSQSFDFSIRIKRIEDRLALLLGVCEAQWHHQRNFYLCMRELALEEELTASAALMCQLDRSDRLNFPSSYRNYLFPQLEDGHPHRIPDGETDEMDWSYFLGTMIAKFGAPRIYQSINLAHWQFINKDYNATDVPNSNVYPPSQAFSYMLAELRMRKTWTGDLLGEGSKYQDILNQAVFYPKEGQILFSLERVFPENLKVKERKRNNNEVMYQLLDWASQPIPEGTLVVYDDDFSEVFKGKSDQTGRLKLPAMYINKEFHFSVC